MSKSGSANPERGARQPDAGRRRFWQGAFAGGLAGVPGSIGFSAFAHGGGAVFDIEPRGA